MSNKKLVGLCIVYKNHNYGSILQSYATLIKLEELGVDYEIINYSHPKNICFYLSALSRLRSKDAIYSKVRSLKRKISQKTHPEYAHNDSIRARKFDEFIGVRFSRFSKPINDYEELKKYSQKYTDVLVGSDQLWLPSGLRTNFYNLMFTQDETNRIAYSASFGVSAVPKYQTEKTKEYLERIQHISLREEAGQKIVKELTGRDVPVILDPTMIVSRAQWDEKIEDIRLVEGEYILCYFLGNNPAHRREALKLSQYKKMNIVVLRHLDEYIPDDEGFGDIALFDIGPAEFVNLIRHAAYVCTDSFHGSVFSIIYHRPFVSFNRYTSGANSRNSRLDTLFSNIGVSRRYNGDIIGAVDDPVDWESVDEKLDALRRQSSDFIRDALGLSGESCTKQTGEDVHRICSEGDCTGCFACSDACPENAISMKMDQHGFWRPSIDLSSCINCNSCNRVCPVNCVPETYGPTRAFAFQNQDERVRFESSSGGFFHAVAKKTIEDGGVVCGAAFDANMHLRHTFVEKVEDLDPLQKSKYVQSSMNGVFRRIKEYLKAGRPVLFVGVGCQAAALRNYVGNHENLFILDLVCHGVPSTGLFDDWIAYLEKKYGKVTDVRFRDKSYGYLSPNVKVLFENGKRIEACRDANIYSHLFFRHFSVRDCCYSCRYKTTNRTSDITLGDLWFMRKHDQLKDDNRGATVVFAHSDNGIALCRGLCKVELDTNEVLKKNARTMVKCVSPAKDVRGFWARYTEDGFEAVIDLYERNTMKSRIKYLLKPVMNRSGFSEKYYLIKHRKRENDLEQVGRGDP